MIHIYDAMKYFEILVPVRTSFAPRRRGGKS